MARKLKDYNPDLMERENNKSTESSPAEVEKMEPETRNGTIEDSLTVKLRCEPNFESKVLSVLRKGDRVKILARTDGFCKVCIGVDKIGYVSSKFIKEE